MRPLPFRAVLVEAVVSALVFFVVGLSIWLWMDGRTLQEAFSIALVGAIGFGIAWTGFHVLLRRTVRRHTR
ncbi:MAG: hypothetical protein NZ572_06150 [Thermoflexus sp.]|nr:hypothetical protein [Thermoflexus sp.]